MSSNPIEPPSIKQIENKTNDPVKDEPSDKKDITEIQSQETSTVVEEQGRVSVHQWNSAIFILEGLCSSLEDLVFNNGMVYKVLLNAFIQSQNNPKKKGESTGERPEEIDPVEKLMQDIKYCKNRRERKILLAKFNYKMGIAWGEHRKILPEHKMTEVLNEPIDQLIEERVISC